MSTDDRMFSEVTVECGNRDSYHKCFEFKFIFMISLSGESLRVPSNVSEYSKFRYSLKVQCFRVLLFV